MKIEILQEQLIKALGYVERAIASRAQLPVLANCLIEAKKEGIVLSSTDLELGIRVKVAAKVEGEGKITVPAKMLSEFLGTIAPGKIEIILEGETLKVKAGTYSAKFQTMSADEFPQLPDPTSKSVLGEIEMEKLNEVVGRVIFASARDSLRPVLTGILWEVGGGKVKLVATDGFRLGIEELPIGGSSEKTQLLVPNRAMAELIRLGESEKIKIGHLSETNQVYFETEEILLVSQLIEGNFPDYQKIVPKEFSSELTVEKSELLQAVKAAHIFARDNSNMVMWEIKTDTLELTSNSPEKGECRVEVPIKLQGETGEIVFNAKYILDYLGVVEAEKIVIGLGGKLAPGMMKEEGRVGKYVVMPINA